MSFLRGENKISFLLMLVLCQMLHTKFMVLNPGEIGKKKVDVRWYFSYVYQK